MAVSECDSFGTRRRSAGTAARDVHSESRASVQHAFVFDAVSVARQPICSSSGTAFATPHSKIFGSVSEEPGWRIERFHTHVLSPWGRSAKMPAVFSFQESFGLLQNEKSMNIERYLIIKGRCQWWSRCKCNA